MSCPKMNLTKKQMDTGKSNKTMIIQLLGKSISIETAAALPGAYFLDYTSYDPAMCSVSVDSSEIEYEKSKSFQEDIREGRKPIEHTNEYLEFIAIQRKITEMFFYYDTLLFHGSVVAVDGEAYLFTAKSGTGKSTHTRLWREMLGDRAVMVNDDKPFLEIKPEGVTAWGSPWMGKHRLGANIGVPLKAICILERGEENRISPIRAQEALPMLMQQSQRPQKPQNFPKYLELIDKLAGNVAFYRMTCNMNPQAAEMAYRAMSGEQTVK